MLEFYNSLPSNVRTMLRVANWAISFVGFVYWMHFLHLDWQLMIMVIRDSMNGNTMPPLITERV